MPSTMIPPQPGDEASAAAAAPAARLLRVIAGGRLLGVPLADIREIVPLGRLTRLPGVPSWVMGIMNLRGVLVTVLDLGRRVAGGGGDENRTVATSGRVALLVSLDSGGAAGCVVDGVRGVIPMPESLMAAPGNADGPRIVSGVADHEGESIVLVDLRALVQDALG